MPTYAAPKVNMPITAAFFLAFIRMLSTMGIGQNQDNHVRDNVGILDRGRLSKHFNL